MYSHSIWEVGSKTDFDEWGIRTQSWFLSIMITRMDHHGSSSVLFGHVSSFFRAPLDFQTWQLKNKFEPDLACYNPYTALNVQYFFLANVQQEQPYSSNVVKTLVNHFPNHHFDRCYIRHFQSWAVVKARAGQDMFQSTAAMNSFNSWVFVASRT